MLLDSLVGVPGNVRATEGCIVNWYMRQIAEVHACCAFEHARQIKYWLDCSDPYD